MIEDVDLDDDHANAWLVLDHLLRRSAESGPVRAWERYRASWPSVPSDAWWCSYSGEADNPSVLEPWSRPTPSTIAFDREQIVLSPAERDKFDAAEEIHRIATDHTMPLVDAAIRVFTWCDVVGRCHGGFHDPTDRWFYMSLGARLLYERTLYFLACHPDRALLRNARRLIAPATGLSDPTDEQIIRWLELHKEVSDAWAEHCC